MLGLVLNIAGILIVVFREVIERTLPKRPARSISLAALFVGALLGVIGATLQFSENRQLVYQVTDVFQRDIEHARRLGTYALDLGKTAVTYFIVFEDEVLGYSDPNDQYSWILLDLERGIRTLHTPFDIAFESISVEEAKQIYTLDQSPSNPFFVMHNVYGSNWYQYEVGTKIWATTPSSTTIENWFYIGWLVEYITYLQKHRIDEPPGELNREYNRLVFIASRVGLPEELFERWMADLLTLEGYDLDHRTNTLLFHIEYYKRMIWDQNPFAFPKFDHWENYVQ